MYHMNRVLTRFVWIWFFPYCSLKLTQAFIPVINIEFKTFLTGEGHQILFLFFHLYVSMAYQKVCVGLWSQMTIGF